jgi:RimJ/RimL family protein N-acetyltransferase
MKGKPLKNLHLRQLTESDASFMLSLLNSPGWLEHIGDRGVKTLEAAKAYILNGPAKSFAENGFGTYLVELISGGEAIGICGLIKRPGLDDVDIGFAFLPEYEGKGYAFEAAQAVLAEAVSDLGLKRVVAITTVANSRSIRLLEKLGFRYEKNIRIPGDPEELKRYGLELQPTQ